MGLNVTSVTPTVNVKGTAGGAPSSVEVVAAFGGGLGTVTTVYPFSSRSCFKKSDRSFDAFFSTMAHLTPSRSSNSWFLLIAIKSVLQACAQRVNVVVDIADKAHRENTDNAGIERQPRHKGNT